MELETARVWLRVYAMVGRVVADDWDPSPVGVEARYKLLANYLDVASLEDWDNIIREARLLLRAAGE